MMYKPTPQLQIADRIYKTSVSGLWYIDHKKFGDERGFFSELGLLPDVEKVIGFPFKIAQLNLAHSVTNVTRGFHAENWNKYISVIRGTCFTALADVRPESPTYRVVESFLLGDSEDALDGSLFITKGLGNSLCAVGSDVDYLYAVDALYRERDTAGDVAFSLFDPDLTVDWPIPREQMIISDRDKAAITLRSKYPESFK